MLEGVVLDAVCAESHDPGDDAGGERSVYRARESVCHEGSLSGGREMSGVIQAAAYRYYAAVRCWNDSKGASAATNEANDAELMLQTMDEEWKECRELLHEMTKEVQELLQLIPSEDWTTRFGTSDTGGPTKELLKRYWKHLEKVKEYYKEVA
jgi:hypothetical protein